MKNTKGKERKKEKRSRGCQLSEMEKQWERRGGQETFDCSLIFHLPTSLLSECCHQLPQPSTRSGSGLSFSPPVHSLDDTHAAVATITHPLYSTNASTQPHRRRSVAHKHPSHHICYLLNHLPVHSFTQCPNNPPITRTYARVPASRSPPRQLSCCPASLPKSRHSSIHAYKHVCLDNTCKATPSHAKPSRGSGRDGAGRATQRAALRGGTGSRSRWTD
ncbi:uncharacterized protein J3D65DRAFT_612067, partial [Phyllosticta citribraziliensis]